jgi:Domain of unknown function (DUF5076)
VDKGESTLARELLIPPEAQDDPNSVEIARVWAAKQQQHVSLSWDLWPDPAIWGVVLADLAGHVANAFQQERGLVRRQTLERIQEFFNKELDNPTDAPEGKVLNKRRGHRRP